MALEQEELSALGFLAAEAVQGSLTGDGADVLRTLSPNVPVMPQQARSLAVQVSFCLQLGVHRAEGLFW